LGKPASVTTPPTSPHGTGTAVAEELTQVASASGAALEFKSNATTAFSVLTKR
jgi:hypothetical protein